MNDTILQIHNAAMDLVDLARIKKAKEGDTSSYTANMKAAYELELYAANKLSDLKNDNDLLWKASLLRNAGWLAEKCGYYKQALRLAELGLKISNDNYEISQLRDLKKKVKGHLLKVKTEKDKKYAISGILSSADFRNSQIMIEEKDSGKTTTFSIPKEQIIQLVRYFLGDMVEIEFQKDEKGLSILKDIRLAA